MYFTSGGDRAFEILMQGKPVPDHLRTGKQEGIPDWFRKSYTETELQW